MSSYSNTIRIYLEIEPPSTTTIISQDSAHAIMTTALPYFIYVNLVLIVLMMYHMNKHNSERLEN
jgi:Na+/H+ antiporter NhaC